MGSGWLAPILKVVNGPGPLAAAARSAVVGTAPYEARLHAWGAADDPICKACGTAVGSLSHRVLHCPVLERSRRQFLCGREEENGHFGVDTLPALLANGFGGMAFCERGILSTTLVPTAPALRPERRWYRGRTNEPWTGNIFTDGAVSVIPEHPSFNRGGWAAIAMGDDIFRPQLHVAVWGTLEAEQTVPRAELMAILVALQHAAAPCVIHVDHKNHVDDIRKGKAHCCHIDREHVDLWRRIWFILEDLGGPSDQVRIIHVSSHQQEHAGETPREAYRRKGNAWADRFACLARNANAVPKETIATVRGLYHTVVAHLRWLAYAIIQQRQKVCDYTRKAAEKKSARGPPLAGAGL